MAAQRQNALSEPRAEQREALRERAVPARRARIAPLRKAGSAMQSRSNRSLWPEFWRIPAPRSRLRTNGRPAPKRAFRAASGAARSAAGASGSGEARADCAAAQSGIRNAVRRRPLTLAGILANSGPRSRLRTNGRVASKYRFASLSEPSAKRIRIRIRIQSRERSSAPALRERAVPPRQTGKAAHLAGLYNPARCSACGGLLRRLHRILVE